jgi:5-hydroxyisourate hydrolase-like protein (transthyretin family)
MGSAGCGWSGGSSDEGGMTSLGTHVPLRCGRPASGVKVTLSRADGEIARGTTNGDGRCPELAQAGLAPGRYTPASP